MSAQIPIAAPRVGRQGPETSSEGKDTREGAPELLCGARLHHNHGVSDCYLPENHSDFHTGVCWGCYEDDADTAELRWSRDGESWT